MAITPAPSASVPGKFLCAAHLPLSGGTLAQEPANIAAPIADAMWTKGCPFRPVATDTAYFQPLIRNAEPCCDLCSGHQVIVIRWGIVMADTGLGSQDLLGAAIEVMALRRFLLLL